MPSAFPKIPLTGGVNLFAHPKRIADNELVQAKNLIPDEQEMLQLRGGTQVERELVVQKEIPYNLAFTPSGNAKVILITRYGATFSDLGIYVIGNGAVADDTELSASPSIANKVLRKTAKFRPPIVLWGRDAYVLDGGVISTSSIQPAWKIDGSSNTISPMAWDNSQSYDSVPHVACIYRGRMVWANFGNITSGDFRRHITFSDVTSPTLVHTDFLAANGRSFEVGSPGDRIVAMAEISLSAVGTPAESALLVLLEHSAFIITGEPLQTTEAATTAIEILGDLQVSKVNINCGCVSAQTVVRTDYGVIWASHDDVWMMAGGSVPTRIGTKIRPALGHTPADYRYLWHAEYHGGFYRLAVSDDTISVDELTPMNSQWWLDLREGSPQNWQEARWYGPQEYRMAADVGSSPTPGTYIMARNTRETTIPALYAAHWGAQGGGSYSTWLVRLDVDSAYDSAMNSNGVTTVLGTQNQIYEEYGNTIDWEITTKEYDADEPASNKVVGGAELYIYVDEVSKVAVNTIIDGGRQTDEQEIFINPEAVYIPQVDADTGVTSEEFQSLLVPTDPDKRLCGKSVQLQISSVAGWHIDSETLLSLLEIADVNEDYISAYPADGSHFTLTSLLTALTTAVNNAAFGSGRVLGDFTFEIVDNKVSIYHDSSSPFYLRHSERASKYLASRLGFPDPSNPANSQIWSVEDTAGPTMGMERLTAQNSARRKIASKVKIGGIVLRAHMFGRRTKG